MMFILFQRNAFFFHGLTFNFRFCNDNNTGMHRLISSPCRTIVSWSAADLRKTRSTVSDLRILYNLFTDSTCLNKRTFSEDYVKTTKNRATFIHMVSMPIITTQYIGFKATLECIINSQLSEDSVLPSHMTCLNCSTLCPHFY